MTVEEQLMRNFAIFATYYFHVSFKEQKKQPRVGVEPGTKGRADFLPISLYASLPMLLSLSLSFFVLPLSLTHSLAPSCPLLIILG